MWRLVTPERICDTFDIILRQPEYEQNQVWSIIPASSRFDCMMHEQDHFPPTEALLFVDGSRRCHPCERKPSSCITRGDQASICIPMNLSGHPKPTGEGRRRRNIAFQLNVFVMKAVVVARVLVKCTFGI